MLKRLTVLIPTYNNSRDLQKTLYSIEDLLGGLDLIIIDSSSFHPVNFEFRSLLSTKSIWTEPLGVYNAINAGLRRVKTEFVMVLNSGDIGLSENLLKVINENFELGRFNSIALIGGQRVKYKELSYVYSPTFSSVWPHQSVIYRADLHNELGFYNENFKVISDQLFFELVKTKYGLDGCLFVDDFLTEYDVTGISSHMNLANLFEYKYLNKIRGLSNGRLYLRFVVYQLAKWLQLDFNYIWHSLKVKIREFR